MSIAPSVASTLELSLFDGLESLKPAIHGLLPVGQDSGGEPVGIIVTKPGTKAQRLEQTNPAYESDFQRYVAENPECLPLRDPGRSAVADCGQGGPYRERPNRRDWDRSGG